MICPGTKRPPPIASELESVPAETDGGRAPRGVEYFGITGDPPPKPPEPSLGPAGGRGAADGVRPGPVGTGAGESSVSPSPRSGVRSRVAASLKSLSSVSPIPIGSSPNTVTPLSTSGAVEEPHDEQKRDFGETCLPQAEQNMERRFYQRNRPKTILCVILGWTSPAAARGSWPNPYEALSTCTAVP